MNRRADGSSAPTALVLDGRSGQAVSFVRSLGKAGWRVLAPTRTRAARSRFTTKAVPIPESVSDADRFVTEAAGVVARERVDVVVPCSDASAELIWEHADQFTAAAVVGGDRTSFELVTDRALLLAEADRLGFPTPRWFTPGSADEAPSLLASLGLPCIVKPRRSFAHRGSRLVQRRHQFVRSEADLAPALEELAEPDGRLPILQEYVPGRALSVTTVLRQGRPLIAVARETFSFFPVAGGSSVWKRTIGLDEPGVEQALEFLVRLGYEGLAELEYQLPADGVPRLMEINARAHAWTDLAIAAGVDLPLIAASAALGIELPPPPPYRVGVEMRWPAGEYHRLQAALRLHPRLPPGTTRRDVIALSWPLWRPGMRYDIVRLTDPRPMFPRRARG